MITIYFLSKSILKIIKKLIPPSAQETVHRKQIFQNHRRVYVIFKTRLHVPIKRIWVKSKNVGSGICYLCQRYISRRTGDTRDVTGVFTDAGVDSGESWISTSNSPWNDTYLFVCWDGWRSRCWCRCCWREKCSKRPKGFLFLPVFCSGLGWAGPGLEKWSTRIALARIFATWTYNDTIESSNTFRTGKISNVCKIIQINREQLKLEESS